jgi:acetyl-CoA carboxylase carboxyl transferase subunit beta
MSRWIDDLETPGFKPREGDKVSKVPEGIWVKCPKCQEVLQAKVLRENLGVCPSDAYHFRISASERISMLTDRLPNANPDEGLSGQAFEPYAEGLSSKNPLDFQDQKPYADRLIAAGKATGQEEAFLAGKATLKGIPYHLGVFEFRFLGGSMGSVVGEKIARVFERALADKLPAVVVSASGGARMQEGILSLMQMAKTSAMIQRMREEGLPYISVLTDPTTGGVAASFAMLGDIIMAEPNALIGFAGPRVIEQTMKRALPPGFQRSEFLHQKGFLDRIVPRQNMSAEIAEWMLRLGRSTCKFPKSLLEREGLAPKAAAPSKKKAH